MVVEGYTMLRKEGLGAATAILCGSVIFNCHNSCANPVVKTTVMMFRHLCRCHRLSFFFFNHVLTFFTGWKTKARVGGSVTPDCCVWSTWERGVGWTHLPAHALQRRWHQQLSSAEFAGLRPSSLDVPLRKDTRRLERRKKVEERGKEINKDWLKKNVCMCVNQRLRVRRRTSVNVMFCVIWKESDSLKST